MLIVIFSPGVMESSKRKFISNETSPTNGRRSTSVPATARLGEGATYLRTVASGGRLNQRRHNFTQKTIIKSENCVPCGNRLGTNNFTSRKSFFHVPLF